MQSTGLGGGLKYDLRPQIWRSATCSISLEVSWSRTWSLSLSPIVSRRWVLSCLRPRVGKQTGEVVLWFTLFISVKHFKITIGNTASKVRVSLFQIMHCKYTVPNIAPDREWAVTSRLSTSVNLLSQTTLVCTGRALGGPFNMSQWCKGWKGVVVLVFFFFKSVQELLLYHCYVKNCQSEVWGGCFFSAPFNLLCFCKLKEVFPSDSISTSNK